MSINKKNSTTMATNSIKVNPSAIARVLTAVALVLVLASIGCQLYKYLIGSSIYLEKLINLLNVDGEKNIPTIFSMLLLFSASSLLSIIAILRKNQKSYDATKWAILASIFFFLANDEILSFHERLNAPMRSILKQQHHGILHFTWVIPAIAILCIVALLFLKFLMRLPAKTKTLFIMAATIYIGGAIGIEMVGGNYGESHGFDNLTYNMIVSLEESLEMAGMIVFNYALLKHIEHNYKKIEFRLIDCESSSKSNTFKIPSNQDFQKILSTSYQDKN